ncbi:MAG TPA: hypothetical protein VE643_08215 [Nitrososphaeraceae archaeon]|nr:hypothetical protein [Nitrososphaeraceae archaeon]
MFIAIAVFYCSIGSGWGVGVGTGAGLGLDVDSVPVLNFYNTMYS